MTIPAAEHPASPASLATSTLTPSEQILLDAETHSRANKDGGAPVLQSAGRYVDSEPLARAMLAVALLANEAAGAVRLGMGIRKSWFGLVKRPEAQVHLAGGAPAWPADTLEARVLDQARQLSAAAKHDAHDLFGALIDRDVSPDLELATTAVRGLARRGLTGVVETQKTTLRVFKSTTEHPVLNAAGEAALRAHPPATAAALLARCARERPDLWQALDRAIGGTLAAKTIDTSSSDSSDYSSSD